MSPNTNILEGIACPHCGSDGPFNMVVTVTGIAHVSDDGWYDLKSESSEFNGPATCCECGHDFSV